jgi:hypothetical protein
MDEVGHGTPDSTEAYREMHPPVEIRQCWGEIRWEAGGSDVLLVGSAIGKGRQQAPSRGLNIEREFFLARCGRERK